MGPPQTRDTRPSCSSSATSHSDGPRLPRGREHQFIYRNGAKLHAYDRDKAPYPSSFDRDVVELQCMDNAMIVAAKGSASFINFKDRPPRRCLDIGTGLGLWVLSCAKAWPNSTFVGLDMVNIQVPQQFLEPDLADRVEWVHTNILRNKLPFDDDEFDHVHIQCLALGIPENKWHSVFAEVHRVMKPGATIEILEEDAIFPVLPRWYTDPLRAHARSPSTLYPGSVQQPLSYPAPHDTSKLAHEHELLETLYHDVWAERFINPTPSSCIPGYFSAFFERVLVPPVMNFSTPPLAPFAPLPEMSGGPRRTLGGSAPGMQRANSGSSAASAPSPSVSSLLSPLMTDNVLDLSLSHTQSHPHPHSHSPTSTQPTSVASVKSTLSPSPSLSSLHQERGANGNGNGSVPGNGFGPEDGPGNEHGHGHGPGLGRPVRRDSEARSVRSTASQAGSHSSGSSFAKASRRPSVMLLAPSAESTSVGGEDAIDLVPLGGLQEQAEHAQFMHLYRAVTFVLSTKEAMWEELRARVGRRDDALRRFGWREQDYTEKASRARFELAVDQYQSDMRGRIALWHSVVKNGWALPPRDPLTKAEAAEEMRLREDILAAQARADTGEPEPPCRKVRLIFGAKEC
ncbi:hypothetical protein BD413DRAFT_466512 [Trametes elegans]|nr:hypothetical protein BD413DRAFT_466512 [Trametes elegans]